MNIINNNKYSETAQKEAEQENINLIQDTEKGAWISGLPKKSRIITVGQDYVSDGEKVEVAIDERLMSNERVN